MSDEYVFLNLHEANPSYIVVSDPEEIVTKDGTKFMRSQISYLNEDDRPVAMYFVAPKQFSFGVAPEFPFGLPKSEQTDERIKGYKICYNLTDIRTVHNPTADEQYMLDLFDGIHQKVVEKAHLEETLSKIGPAQAIVIRSSKQNRTPHGGVKPLLSDGTMPSPTHPNQRVPDPSKPKRLYAKLMSSKRPNDPEVTVHTKFYDPSNAEVPPKSLINVQGYIEPVFHLQSVYWGAHGSTPFGASIQLKLSEANFTPMNRHGPPKRMLPRSVTLQESLPCEENDLSENQNQNQNQDDASPAEALFSLPTLENPTPVPTPTPTPTKRRKRRVVRRTVQAVAE